MENEAKLNRILLICIPSVLLVLVGIFLIVNANSLTVGASQPIITPSSVPTEASEVGTVHIAPTATPISVQVIANSKMPEGSVELSVNSAALFALSSKEEAEQLLSEYLAISSVVDEGQCLVRSYFDQTVTLRQASEGAELLTVREALSRLLANPAYLSVTKIVNSCHTTVGEIETELINSDSLAKGCRLILNEGSPERWVIYSENVYKAGVECSVIETNRFKVTDSVPRVELLGTLDKQAIPPKRGEKPVRAIESFYVRSPIEAPISGYFGYRDEVMSYGIDYRAGLDFPVYAPNSGIVIFAGERGEYGFVVDILHDNGRAVSRLTHLASCNLELYQRVHMGEHIAVVSRTITKDRQDFHYELIVDGIPVDPLTYIN